MFHDSSVCLFHILAIFKHPVNQDLIGQSDLVYKLNLLGHLNDSGNLKCYRLLKK